MTSPRINSRAAQDSDKTAPSTTSRNARYGLILFLIYLAFYAGFVLLAAFSPATMERTPFAGVNLAIWYGFALIIAAFVLALVYGYLCRASEPGRLGPGESTNQIRNPQSKINNRQ